MIDTQIKNRFEEMRDNYRRSCLVSAGPQEKSGTPSKPAGYCVVWNPPVVSVNEDSQCRLKPADEIHIFIALWCWNKRELQEVSNH